MTPTRTAPVLLALYVVIMPLTAGLPRGSGLPLFRANEVLLITLVVAAAGPVVLSAIGGSRWRLRLDPVDRWLAALVVTGAVMPVLWLLARTGSADSDQLLAALPFVKYAALFLLARLAVRGPDDVALVGRAVIGSATLVAAIAVAQALGHGPLIDLLGRFFVSSAEDVVDGGRATTTIGSSIATGAFLTIAAGLALSWAFHSGRRRWLAAAATVAIGAVATGQAGTVIALTVVALVVAHHHGRMMFVVGWGLLVAAVTAVALRPILTGRLADIDAGTGLPGSWLIRWNNVSELFWPSLADGGWLLGVGPDATVAPPDAWRDVVYLESGYLWLLWVGGVPLLLAAVGFLVMAWRRLDPRGHDGPIASVRLAARAAAAMMLVLTVVDPHLTLRAGADLFFVLVPLGLVGRPLAVPAADPVGRWRSLLAVAAGRPVGARLLIAEPNGATRPADRQAELVITARRAGRTVGRTRLALERRGQRLHGRLTAPIAADDDPSTALVWRAVALCGHSLRLDSLQTQEPLIGSPIERSELRAAGRLAGRLERRRPHDRELIDIDDRSDVAPIGDGLAVRLEVGHTLPRWKRAVDLAVGLPALTLVGPLMLLCAIAIRRSSPGPALYRQLRVGTGGLPFEIYKFRTMYQDNDDRAHRAQNRRELRGDAEAAKDADDPRITPIGRRLRRLSLDELPQLINVVRGEMSLVGPRPSLLWEVELFEPALRRRLHARPGLTGLWQVGGRADVSMTDMLELDIDYVERMGPATDLRCLAGTATAVLTGRGAR